MMTSQVFQKATYMFAMFLLLFLLPVASDNCLDMRVPVGSDALLQRAQNLSKRDDKAISEANDDEGERKNGSQIGQDTWVLEKLGEDFHGYFLDLGAHDGQLLSNTQLLETKGWRGICVEPFPTNFDKRTCIVESSALAAFAGTAKFIKCSGWRSALSGFPHAPGSASIKDDRDQSHCVKVDVPTKPLQKILNENTAPHIIDYVSLDIEGGELDVLQQFPFGDYCVRLWTVEHTSFHGAKPNKLAIRTLLESQGCNVKEEYFDFFAQCQC